MLIDCGAYELATSRLQGAESFFKLFGVGILGTWVETSKHIEMVTKLI